MDKPNLIYQVRLIAFIALILTGVVFGAVGAPGEPTGYEQPSLLRDLLGNSIGDASVHISFFSYKPQLGQFTELLNSLGAPQLDAALMPTASVTLEHTPELSSRLEIGYWSNETEIPPPTNANLSAKLLPISLNLIYRPILLYEFLPLYIGGGVGYSHLSVDGTALDLLKQQGITVDEGNSGLTGFVLIGTGYTFLEDQLTVMLEAKHILKTFTTSGTPPLDLDFDGTALGLSIGFKF